MKSSNIWVAMLVVCLLLAPGVWAQAPASTNQSASFLAPSASAPVVPKVIEFSGTLFDEQNRPMTGPVGITFALYAQHTGGAALWMETQNVRPDESGNYTVLLGTATASGVPQELFASGEARWLGAQPERRAEQPRVLLVSVPYALKAGDAQTLGGRPASDFALANALPASSALPFGGAAAAATTAVIASAQSPLPATLGGTGTTNFIPIWTNSTTLGNSIMSQVGGNVSVGGALQLPATGTASATAGFNSRPFDLFASAWNTTGTGAAVSEHFRLQAEPAGSNTTAPSGKLNLLFQSGTGTPGETGLSINSKGIITFASGQTLPTVTGNETVKGNLSASQLISTVATGTAPLHMTSTTQVPNLNASLLGGLPAGAFALVGAPNTFTGTQTIHGDLALPNTTGSGGVGVITLGGSPFVHNFGPVNTFVGTNAGNFSMTGGSNTAIGFEALSFNTTGVANSASGWGALLSNTTGGNNTASGLGALQNNTTGSFNTASGVLALKSNTTGAGNTASGLGALASNTTGGNNTASGNAALLSNTTGAGNTAMGLQSLHSNTTGSRNIAIGSNAGGIATTGSDNIYIGNAGFAAEGKAIRIGIQGTQAKTFIAGISGVTTGGAGATVLVDANGQLGTVSSSRRYKYDVHDMDEGSNNLLRLRPVTFRYKQAQTDGSHPLQYGLIAEEVAEVYPELVQYAPTGDVNTVLYHLLPAMLLNEVQKQHRQIEAQDTHIRKLTRQVQEMQKVQQQMTALEARLARFEEMQNHSFRTAGGAAGMNKRPDSSD
jgi:endosialidase-like protein